VRPKRLVAQAAPRVWLTSLLRALLVIVTPAAAAYGIYLGNDQEKIYALLVGAALLASGTLVVEWLTLVRPTRKVTSVRDFLLQQYAKGITAPLEKEGLTVRLNLMVPFYPARWAFWRHFRVIWGMGMDSYPDADMWIPRGHGAVGKAYAEGYAAAVDLETTTDVRFPKRLQRKVRHLTCVVSHPVYGREYEPGRPSATRLGVLSIDSTTPGAFRQLSTQECVEGMKQLAAIAGRLIF
jgi:hypothetical protein